MASLLDLPPEIIEMIIAYLQGPSNSSTVEQASLAAQFSLIRSTVASMRNLSPELADLVMPYLQGAVGSSTALMRHRRKMPNRLIAPRGLCRCYHDKYTKGQLLARDGQNLGVEGRDIVRFATVHPYIEDCIKLFRCCEMVDAWNTSMGVVPAATTTIPSAVRTLNVIYKANDSDFGAISSNHMSEARPLSAHFRRYPALHHLILDFSACVNPSQIAWKMPSAFQPTDVPGGNEHTGIQYLRVLLLHQLVRRTDGSSTILAGLAQTARFPKLHRLDINMSLSDDARRGGTPTAKLASKWIATFECLKSVAVTWRSLEVIKVCVRVRLAQRVDGLVACPLWRDALTKIIQSFAGNPACKIELCILYIWGHSDNGVAAVEVPLSAFQQTSNLEWALDDKLAPIDTQSIRATLKHIETKLRMTVPSFNLHVRYVDVRIFEGKSRDLVKIRYRPGTGKKNDSNVQSSKTPPAMDLDCKFNRRESRQFH